MAVNLFGVMTGSQRAGRHMAAHGGGVIINITSIGGINAGPGMVVYRAAKAAVIHFTQCIAIDLAEYGIRANCVAPAHIPTAINTTYDQSEIVRRMQPLQRIGSPDDVANAVVFLASERAEQITGIVMPVDGGTTAGPPPVDVRRLAAKRGDSE
jgi:NAD(P)-dependent dehydrogenase (short-subunit alcohol dehydrogenase family)